MRVLACFAVFLCALAPKAADYELEDRGLATYFERRTSEIEQRWAGKFKTIAEFQAARPELRAQLLEMLGLDPLPERTDLKPRVTGRVDRPEYTVENLHFQSLPSLYVTGNLYLPKKQNGKLPAILYVCGHADMKTNGISLGNKTGYEHHGAWFARHGYVCLMIDTVQLGEIPGIHHGTYREGMWWWNSKGYTPAGVEAWNSMRAIDYLQTRPEVDGEKIGMTGRSGGGAYSWYTAAIDDRVKVAAPIAGITDLRDHVVDGVVEGHCDCMYMCNTYQWDFWLIPALIAPRPLLIGNTDKDRIFPLDGVQRIHAETARIYALHNKPTNLGLLITEGPHKDTQDLQVPVFRWFNRFLKGEEAVISVPATKQHPPMELKVFTELPADQKNSKIHDTFQPLPKSVAVSSDAGQKSAEDLRAFLDKKVFAAWPKDKSGIEARRIVGSAPGGERFTLETERGISNLGRVAKGTSGSNKVMLYIGEKPMATPEAPEHTTIFVQVRASGEQVSDPQKRNEVQVRRRYMLLGTTVDAMRVWDIRAAISFASERSGVASPEITLIADGDHAVNGLYASLYEPQVRELQLTNLPASHMNGPDYLNVLRKTDIPAMIAAVSEDKIVSLERADPELAKALEPLSKRENLKLQ